MQDNYNPYNIDKKFIRQSWKSLSSQLDKELPVKASDKFQKIIILLSTLLILSLFGSAYIWHLYKSNTPIAQLTKEKIKYQEVYVPYYITKEINSQEVNTERDIFLGRTTQKSENSPTQDLYLNASPLPASVIINHPDRINPGQSDLDPLSFLEQSEYNSIASASDEPILDEMNLTPVHPRQNNKNIDYYLGLDGFVSTLSYSGFGLNLSTKIPISDKLRFHTGLGASFISRNYHVLPFFKKESGINLKANTTNLKSASTFYQGLQEFNQIIVPIGLNYSFTERIGLTAGVKLRYTYTETIDNVLKSKVQENSPGNQNLANVFFNNSNLGIYTGFSYNISDKVSVSLDSEWGLHSLLNNNRIDDPSTRKYDLNMFNFSSYFKF